MIMIRFPNSKSIGPKKISLSFDEIFRALQKSFAQDMKDATCYQRLSSECASCGDIALFRIFCRSFQTWHNCTFLFGVCSYTFSHSEFIKDQGPQHVILHLHPDEDLPLEERKKNCPKPADFLGIILGMNKDSFYANFEGLKK